MRRIKFRTSYWIESAGVPADSRLNFTEDLIKSLTLSGGSAESDFITGP